VTVSDTIEYLRGNALTFSRRPGKLETLHRMAALVEEAGVPGLFLEAGVAMGGSAIVIAQTKAAGRPLRLYDVFAMMPPPGARDDARSHEDYAALIGDAPPTEADRVYVANSADLLGFTLRNMRELGVDPEAARISFHKGLFEDTLVVNEPVAFAHLDCDWYDSVRLCLERISPWVSPHGVVLFDDYGVYRGCRRAVHEWLAREDRFQIIHAGRSLAVQRSA
jgi:hypothetical protein